jgi:hypothetical protein
MKTAAIMQRPFNGKVIRQNSKNGFLNLNDLLECHLKDNVDSWKSIDKYIALAQTKEFAETIREAELEQANNLNTPKSGEFILPTIKPIDVFEVKRGRNGGTWAHPYLFLDFAMWLSPKFKLWAMSIIEDKLIELRNEAGDRFKDMMKALKATNAVSPREYAKEASMINFIVFQKTGGKPRDEATSEELDLLNKLQKYNARMIDQGRPFHIRQKECENFARFYNLIK